MIDLIHLCGVVLFLHKNIAGSLHNFSHPLPFPVQSTDSFRIRALFQPLQSSTRVDFHKKKMNSKEVSVHHGTDLLYISSLQSSFFGHNRKNPIPELQNLHIHNHYPLFTVPLPQGILYISFVSLYILSNVPEFHLLPPCQADILLL